MENNDFRTFHEVMKKEDDSLTASMEDYLEMIYRLSLKNGFTRMHQLSEALSVQPPSATKMVQRLSQAKLLQYERYGVIILEEHGKKIGEALLHRHNTIEAFFRLINLPEKMIVAETEKVEHTISPNTIVCFEHFMDFIKDNPDLLERYHEYEKSIEKK